jgi:uncharacterized protein
MPTSIFPHGAPCWMDLSSSDLPLSAEFYASVLGWSATDAGESFGHYHQLGLGDEQIAGMMANTPDTGHPDAWNIYFATTDIEASCTAISAAGGTVLMGPMQVMELGSMAIAADPTGAVFGLWQAGTHLPFDRIGEVGGPAWFELRTRDLERATEFYGSVFGWDIERTFDDESFRYYQAKVNGEPVVGLMDASSSLPDGVPAHFIAYLAVDDTDAAVERAIALGAQLLHPAMDSPFGRSAQISDATGAHLALHGPNKES